MKPAAIVGCRLLFPREGLVIVLVCTVSELLPFHTSMPRSTIPRFLFSASRIETASLSSQRRTLMPPAKGQAQMTRRAITNCETCPCTSDQKKCTLYACSRRQRYMNTTPSTSPRCCKPFFFKRDGCFIDFGLMAFVGRCVI